MFLHISRKSLLPTKLDRTFCQSCSVFKHPIIIPIIIFTNLSCSSHTTTQPTNHLILTLNHQVIIPFLEFPKKIHHTLPLNLKKKFSKNMPGLRKTSILLISTKKPNKTSKNNAMKMDDHILPPNGKIREKNPTLHGFLKGKKIHEKNIGITLRIKVVLIAPSYEHQILQHIILDMDHKLSKSRILAIYCQYLF